MKNIVIYARYSSDAQKKDSITQQVKACKEFAEKNDMNVIKVYKDEAKTGRNDERDEFQKMLRESKYKGFEAVLVWKFDRFARNMRDALNNEKILEDNGVKVISATELIPDGAIGIIVKAVLLGINEYYSVDLAEKTMRGANQNAENCLYNGGTVPLGFKISDEKKYVIDKENAQWVEKIFTMYANGKMVMEICEYLNAMGIKTATGTKFNKASLHTMLNNKKYIGVYTYGDISIPDGVPRIISDELFEKVQKVLEANKKLPARKRAFEEYLLTGKLFCGVCKDKYNQDVMMVGHSGNAKMKYCYYKCKNEKTCGKKMIPKEVIEEQVIQKCRSMLTNKNINSIARRIHKIAQKDNANAMLIRLLDEQKDRQKAKVNLMRTLESCEDDEMAQEILTRVKEINRELEELETQIAKEKTKTMGLNEHDVRFFLTQFRDYDILNVIHRKAIVNMLINRIYVYDDYDGDKKTPNIRLTFILNVGNDTVEITDKLYADIQGNTQGKDVCLSLNSAHQFHNKQNPRVYCCFGGFAFTENLVNTAITGGRSASLGSIVDKITLIGGRLYGII